MEKKTTVLEEMSSIYDKKWLQILKNKVKENSTGHIISNRFLIFKKSKNMLMISKADNLWFDSKTKKNYKIKFEKKNGKYNIFLYRLAIRYTKLKNKKTSTTN